MTSPQRWTRVLPIVLVLALAAPAAVADLLPPVVSPAALADRLAAPPGNVVLLDARPAIKAYLAGHITGAQTVNVDSFRSTAGGVPGTLFPLETIHFVVHRLGIMADTPVALRNSRCTVGMVHK